MAFWAAALIGAGILGLVGLGATAYADFTDWLIFWTNVFMEAI